MPGDGGEDVRESVLVRDPQQHVVEAVALSLPAPEVGDDLGRLGLRAVDEVEHDEREGDDGDDGRHSKDDVRAVVGEATLDDAEADQLEREDEEDRQDDADDLQPAEITGPVPVLISCLVPRGASVLGPSVKVHVLRSFGWSWAIRTRNASSGTAIPFGTGSLCGQAVGAAGASP